jgi:ADP-heptose:LPS heptosyltransferase
LSQAQKGWGMTKERLLLIAYRAYGDMLYTVPVLPYLFEKYDVYLECNTKVYQLMYNDPRFKEIYLFQHERFPREKWSDLFYKRWEKVVCKVKPDRIINLNGSLETTCIAENYQKEFTLPFDKRREFFGKYSFYDSVFKRCELETPKQLRLDLLHYSQKEIDIVETWREKNKNKFIIMMPIAGSTSQKVLHYFKEWINILLNHYKDLHIYITGGNDCKKIVPEHPQVKNACGHDTSIKQIFLMTKYANYVLGPETGVVAAAGMWGTPKTMFCTTSSIYQCTKYQQNDHSIQAPIYCSPCHRAIYYMEDCHTMVGNLKTKLITPLCTKMFRIDDILPFIDVEYKKFREEARLCPPPYIAKPFS